VIREDQLKEIKIERLIVELDGTVGELENERVPIHCGGDGFRGAQRILRIDDKTGSSDLPVGLFVDKRVESYF
jgi:hypothetical protein